MKLSYGLTALAALAPATTDAAFQGYSPCVARSRPSSALDMRRRSPMMRSLMPSARSLLAPSEMFREMDELFDRQFDDFFDSPFLMKPASPFLSRRADLMLPDLATVRRPYRYRITENDDKFQLTVDLPDVKASDMKVSLEQDGRVLRINGMRTVKNGDMSYESSFDKAFVLDRSVDVEKIKANLSEGVMTIDAPKKPKEEPKAVEIPIVELPKIADSPAPETKAEDAKAEEEKKVEIKAETKAEDEEVVDLDKIEEKPKQEEKMQAHEGGEEKVDDLVEDGEFLI